MVRLAKFPILALAVVMVLPMTADAANTSAMYRVSHFGKVVVGKPIKIGLDPKGVKMETITFSEDEATVVVSNRTPATVKGHVGVALFDRKNRLMAAESDSQSITRTFTNIRSGKQATLKVKFKKFLSSFRGVAKYQVVLVTER